MAKNIIRRIGRAACGILCGISLCCLCAVSDNLSAQLLWTASWACVLFLSAKGFIALKNI